MKALKKYAVPIVLAWLLFSAIGTYYVRMESQRTERQAEWLRDELKSHASLLAYQLEQSLSAANVLATLVRQYGEVREFEVVAQSLVANPRLGTVGTLQLAPGGVVSQIYPLKGNEGAMGHNLMTDPERRADVMQAVQTKRLVVSGPFKLIQGGEAIVARLPIFVTDAKRAEQFWGFTIALIRIPDWLKASQLDEFQREGFDYTVSYRAAEGTREFVIHRSDAARELGEHATQRVTLPNGAQLTLAAAPRNGGMLPGRLWLEVALALLAGGLLVAFSYHMVRHRDDLEMLVKARTQSLSEANLQLESEAAVRATTQWELGRSNLFLDSVIENIPHMVFVKDARELRFVRFNKAAEDLTGYRRDEVVGRNDYDFFPPEEADFFAAKDREALRLGCTLDIPEETIATRSNGPRILHTKKIPLLGRNGEPEYLLGISEDITERKSVEHRLHQSEELFRTIAENASDLIAMLEVDGTRVYNNPAYRQVFGDSPPAQDGDSFAEIHPDDRERIRAIFDKTVATGCGERTEFRFQLQDGSVRHIESEGSVIRDARGRVSKVVVVSRDITDRMQAQRRISDQLHFVTQLVDAIPTPVFYKDVSGRYLGCNRAFEEVLGRPREKIIGRGIEELFPPQLAATFGRADRAVLRAPESTSHDEHELTYSDGTHHHLSIHKAVYRNADHTVGGLVGVMMDITHRKESEEKLRLAARVFENSGEGIIITDADNNILMVNKAFTQSTRYSADEVIGHNPRLLSSGEHDPAFYRDMWQSLRETGEWHGEVRNRRKTGELFTEWLTLGAVYNDAGDITNYVAVFADLTARKQVEERLHFLAFYDALTELPNRVLFVDRLDRAIIQARHAGRQVAVMFLDLDRFSVINETLGHASGDNLLKEVSKRLQEAVHQRDSVARMGGDEFTIVLPDIRTPDDAAAVAQSILSALAAPFDLMSNEVFVSASIGISVFPGDGDGAEELIKNADSAMHRAIELGGNNYRFYTLDMNAKSYERMILGTDLRHALERGELQIHFQPLADMQTGRVVGAEALLRWHRQGFGMVPPAAFVPLLEETGLIVSIGEWALRTACLHCKSWEANGHGDLFVAVNFSAQQFERQDIVDVVRRVVEEGGLDPRKLEIELTEGILMRHAEETIKTLNGLKAMGISLSVDDFGTGYSSLSYLKRFPLDTLKIDRSFVHDAPDEPDAIAIINAVMAMGHSLKLKVIAEGVENVEQMAFLRSIGCDIMQGYHVSRALPPEEFLHFLNCQAAGVPALPAPHISPANSTAG